MATITEMATVYVAVIPHTKSFAGPINKEFGAISKAADKAGKDIGDSAERAGKKSGGLFSGALGGAVAKGAKFAGAAVVTTLGTMLWKGFGRLKAIEQAEAKLRGLGHSAEVVDKVMKNALASVKGTAYGLGDAATAAANAIAAGIKPGQDLERYLKGIGDAATIAGTDFNSMGAIFGKVAAKNKIQGMEINQLSQQGVPILQLLAKQMGVTAEEAGKLASKGKISFADFQKAMESGMQGAALEGGKTVSGAFDNLIASLGRVGANILKPFYKLLPGFLTWVTGLLGPVEEFATKAGEFIVDAFSGIGSLVFKGDFTAEFNKAFNIEEDSPVVDWLLKTRTKIGEAFDGIGALFKGDFTADLNSAFAVEEDSGFVDWMLRIRESFTGMFDEAEGGVSVMDRIRGAFDAVTNSTFLQWMIDLNDTLNEKILPALADIGGAVIDYFVSAFAEGDRVLREDLLPLLSSFIDSPFVQWIKDVISEMVERLLPVFDTIADVIKNDVLPAFTAVSNFLSALGIAVLKFYDAWANSSITQFLLGVLKPVLLGFFSFVASLITSALKVIGGFFKIIKGIFTGDWGAIWDGAKQIFGAFFDHLKNTFGIILDLFGAFFSTIGEWFGSWLGPLFDGFKDAVSTAFGFIVDAVKVAGEVIATVANVIGTVIGGIVAVVLGISKVVGGIVAWVVGLILKLVNVVVAPIVAAFKIIIPAALDSMARYWRGTWDMIWGIVEAIWGFLGPIFETIRDWLSKYLTVAVGVLKAGFTTAWDAISNAVSTVWNFLLDNVFTPIRNWLEDYLARALRNLRNNFAAIWNAISSVVSTVWNWLLDNVFTPIRDWLEERLAIGLRNLRNNFTLIWNAISSVVSTVWNWLLDNVFTPIRNWLEDYLAFALRNLRNNFTLIWNAIQTVVSTVWNWLLDNVFTPIRNWFTVTLPAALAVVRDWFASVWNAIWTTVQGIWARLLAVFTTIKDWFERIITAALQILGAAVKRVWDGIWDAISFVWNEILVKAFRPIVDWLREKLKSALDFFLKIGKAVWAAFSKAVGDAKDYVLGGFKNLQDGLDTLRGWFDRVVNTIGDIWEGLKAKVRKPIVFVVNSIIRDGIVKAWNAVATRVNLPPFEFTGMSENAAGGIIGGHSPTDKADNIPAWLTAGEFVTKRRSVRQMRKRHPGALEYINQHGSLPGFAGGGMVYQSMQAWIRKNAPGVAITSTYRPGGGTSYHASGRALDLAPSMALFNKILATFGSSIAELIYTPAGGRQVKNGKAVPASFWGARVASMHYNHVHWAMRGPVGDVPPGAVGDLGEADGGAFMITNPAAAAIKFILSPLFNGVRGLVDAIGGMFGQSEWVDIAKAYAKAPVDAVETFLNGVIDKLFPDIPMGSSEGGVDEVGMTTTPGAELKSTAAVRGMVQQMATAQGWGRGQNWEALKFIIQRESAWNPSAKNPTSTAYGLFQFLNTTWASVGARKTADPTGQTQAGLAYIKQRYGTPVAARAFWQRNNWYGEGGDVLDPFGRPTVRPDYTELMDRGGILRPGVTLVHNQTGKPETVRTWEQEQSLRSGTNITINGIKYDAVGEFASELNYALARASARSRY